MAAKAKTNRLGRGLASLISDLEDVTPETGEAGAGDILPIDVIRPNKANPRRDFSEVELDELAQSIRERGVIQPILVRPAKRDKYEIVAGERRWRAAQRAKLHEVPVVIRTLSDQEALEVAIVENVQRSDLNAIEEAQGYAKLIDAYGHSQEDLASIVGKSRSHLANMLRLLKLPASVRKLVQAGQLSAGHARALVGRSDAATLAEEIVARKLSVREIERLVKDLADNTAAPRKARLKDADTKAAETELAEALGLTVSIAPGKGEAGELRIRYRTLDQLEVVRNRLLAT